MISNALASLFYIKKANCLNLSSHHPIIFNICVSVCRLNDCECVALRFIVQQMKVSKKEEAMGCLKLINMIIILLSDAMRQILYFQASADA